jgi:opacity protein-like surface antigen
MRKLLLALAALAVAGPATAADLSVKAPPYDPWTGFYIGANAGYTQWRQSDAPFMNDGIIVGGSLGGQLGNALPTFLALPGYQGAIGGIQAGYNWRLAKRIVAGLEADVGFSRIKSDAAFAAQQNGSANFDVTTLRTQLDWLATIRGRFGGLIGEHLLLYGTSGLALRETKHTLDWTNNGPLDPVPQPLATAHVQTTKTGVGLVIGGGAELALADHWSIKGEALYFQFGTDTQRERFSGPVPPNNPANFFEADGTNPQSGYLLRMGINYRFN